MAATYLMMMMMTSPVSAITGRSLFRPKKGKAVLLAPSHPNVVTPKMINFVGRDSTGQP